VIVVDASTLLEALLGAPADGPVAKRVFDPQQTLHAPHLIDLEVAQVVRRLAAAGEIDHERGRQTLVDLADLPLYRYPHAFLLSRVWNLRNNFTAYDAAYVALAEVLGAPLLTRDRRLAAAANDLVPVELV